MRRIILSAFLTAAAWVGGATLAPYGGFRVTNDYGTPGGAIGLCGGGALSTRPGGWAFEGDVFVAGPYSGLEKVTDVPDPSYTAWELSAASLGGGVFDNGAGLGWALRWSRVFIYPAFALDSEAVDHISAGPRFTWAYKTTSGFFFGDVGAGAALSRYSDAPHMNAEYVNTAFGMGYELALKRGGGVRFGGDLSADIFPSSYDYKNAVAVRFTVGPAFKL